MDITAGHVVLCLNGKTVTAVGSERTADDRFYYPRNGGSLSIVDCTAHTETVEGKEVYKAGKLTGATAAAIMFHNATSTTGTVNIYDGIITGNSRAGSGGGFVVQGKGKLNIYGGEIVDNHATNGTGGAIYLNSANNTLYIEDARIADNSASSYSGAIHSNNAAVTIKNSQITGNSGADTGAITMKGAVLTLEDAQITGNITTKGAYGAIHPYNSGGTATVKVKGETIITGNYYGDPANKVERNLYLRNHWYTVVPQGLTGDAKIGLTLEAARIADTSGKQYITGALENTDAGQYFSSDNAAYIIGFTEDNRMILKEKPEEPDHPHKLCLDAACAEHAELDFKNWTDSTSLPTSGDYSLQTDVVLTAQTVVAGTLNICLNGHTIRVNNANTRAFALDNGDILSITDCQGTGTITGGSRTYGGAISVHRGSTLNLFAGTISGNTALGEEGGALYVVGGNDQYPNGAIVNMYGGQISGNFARSGSAVRLTNPSGAGTMAQFHMYGGQITGNKSTGTSGSNIGAVYGDKAVIKLLGGEITGNDSATYGTVYVTANTQLTLGGNIKIQGNTVKEKPANLYLSGDAQFAVEGLTEAAMVAVSTSSYNRFISSQTADCSKNFASDSVYRAITYKDNALYISGTTEHQHCVCAAATTSGCDHANQVWQAWESNTSLPGSSGYYYLINDVVLEGQAYFNGDTHLCLNGHSVTLKEGTVNGRILKINDGGELTLTDCQGKGVLSGGNAEYGGAANINRGGVFHMYGGIFSGNTSLSATGGQGAAVYVQATKEGVPGGIFHMYGGQISGNQAVWGGAVYGANASTINIYGGIIRNNDGTKYGGGIYATGAVTNISGATFVNNTSGSGGAIYITGAYSKLNITDSTFTDNTVSGYAGGTILAQSNGTEIVVKNSVFTGSKATAGGAIFASTNTKLTVEGSTFTGNTADQGAAIYTLRCDSKITGTTMEKNTAKKQAAGMYISAGSCVLENIAINNNQGGSGVALMINSASATIDGKKTILYPTVTLVSGTISGNKSSQGSGGAVLMQGKSTFNMKGGKITGNSAKWCGGIYASTNSTFNMYGGSISGNYTEQSGGGVYGLRSTLNLYGGSISGNTAKKNGGGVFLSGAKLNLSGTWITGNRAVEGTGGGGICTGSIRASNVLYEPTINMTGGAISNNKGRHGGAVLLQGSSKTVFNMKGGELTDNEATEQPGGAIYASTKTTVNMTGGVISGNSSAKQGGAVYHSNSCGNYTGVEIHGNTAASSGGAFLITGSASVVTMKDVKIYDNKGGSGGGICHQGKAHLTLENVEINNCNSQYSGGAIYVSNNTYLDMVNCNIHDNTAESTGGAMYFGNNTYITMDGVTVEKNSTTAEGGAIFSRSGCTIVKNSKFIGNKADLAGGAVNLYKPTMQGVSSSGDYKTGHVFENCQFRDNVTVTQGGALYVDAGSKATVKDSVMIGNHAGMEGSALWAMGDLVMDGLDVTDNTSDHDGYALYLAESRFDGHSYYAGLMQMGGDIIVENNQGGDMFLGEKTTVAVLENGFGEKTNINITLASGVLTNVVYGEYDYQGGNLVYTITYGSRSLTEPEVDPNLPSAKQEEGGKAPIGDVLLYVGVGVFALAVAAVAVLLALKKKKKTPAADGTQN